MSQYKKMQLSSFFFCNNKNDIANGPALKSDWSSKTVGKNLY